MIDIYSWFDSVRSQYIISLSVIGYHSISLSYPPSLSLPPPFSLSLSLHLSFSLSPSPLLSTSLSPHLPISIYIYIANSVDYRFEINQDPNGPSAFYTDPPLNGSRPGVFSLNKRAVAE